jgi:hypothetical protein
MTLTLNTLANIQYIPSTVGSLLANSTSQKTYITGIVLFNGNTSNLTVKLYNVPNSGGALGTAGASNQFFEQSLVPQETLFLEFPKTGICLSGTNDSIQGSTTTASKVTVQFIGAIDL